MFEPGTRIRWAGDEGVVLPKPKWVVQDDPYVDILLADGVWLALPDELEVVDV